MPYKNKEKYRECCREAAVRYRARQKAKDHDGWMQKQRDYKIYERFGITRQQYDDRLAAQDGKCGICGKPEAGNGRFRLSVDHDRQCCKGRISCGKCIRGLLCNSCNRGIGLLGDSIEALERAIAYLKRFRTVSSTNG